MNALTTLHPRFERPEVIHALRAEWAQSRRLRISEVLRPGLAERIANAALERPFGFFEKHQAEVHAVFWRQPHHFGDAHNDFPELSTLQTVLLRDLPALATAVTGQALEALETQETVVFDLYTRGSYLDPHTDQGAERLVAYVLGLTRDSWPAEQGGHLEFLELDERTVIDRVSPGFDTLDLFCIYPLLRPHQVPLVQVPVTRLSINGWLTGELKDPREEG